MEKEAGGERRNRLKEEAMIIREKELKVLLEQLEELRKDAEHQSSDMSLSGEVRAEYCGKEDAFGQAIRLIQFSAMERA